MGTWGSYLAFGKLGRDHRGLILDIPDEYIFGFTLHDFVPPSARRLKLDNPAIVQKYNNTLWKILKETGLDKDIENIHQNSTYTMKLHVQRHFEQIDAKIQEAQLCAEKKCAHIYAGHVQWPPQVKGAYELVEFWSMAVDAFWRNIINRRNFKKLCQWHQLIYSLDMEKAKEDLRNAHKFQGQVKKQDASFQIKHLTKLAMEKERHRDKSSATYLWELKQV